MNATRPITEGLFVDQANGPRLIAGRCPACTRLHFPAGPTCPYCGAEGCAETRVGPEGRLCLYTAVLSPPPGYRGPVPYGFGVVELTGGLCVIARLGEARLERLRPGLSVRLAVEPLFTDAEGREVRSYVFHPEAP